MMGLESPCDIGVLWTISQGDFSIQNVIFVLLYQNEFSYYNSFSEIV